MNFSTPAEFVDSVLALKPSIAVFDCDGTLWSGDAGADFFYWEIERGIVSPEMAEWAHQQYEGYKAGNVSEEQICGEMVTMNRGVSHEKLQRAATEFFDEVVSHRIFPELQELTRKLIAQGCELWAVSSTNNWVVEVGAERFGIPRERVSGGVRPHRRRQRHRPPRPRADRRTEGCRRSAKSSAGQWKRSSATRCTTRRCWRWRSGRSA